MYEFIAFVQEFIDLSPLNMKTESYDIKHKGLILEVAFNGFQTKEILLIQRFYSHLFHPMT